MLHNSVRIILIDSELWTDLNEKILLYIQKMICKKMHKTKLKLGLVETSVYHKDIQDILFHLISFRNNDIL